MLQISLLPPHTHTSQCIRTVSCSDKRVLELFRLGQPKGLNLGKTRSHKARNLNVICLNLIVTVMYMGTLNPNPPPPTPETQTSLRQPAASVDLQCRRVSPISVSSVGTTSVCPCMQAADCRKGGALEGGQNRFDKSHSFAGAIQAPMLGEEWCLWMESHHDGDETKGSLYSLVQDYIEA